jgi:hypothetical protein
MSVNRLRRQLTAANKKLKWYTAHFKAFPGDSPPQVRTSPQNDGAQQYPHAVGTRTGACAYTCSR